MKISKIEPIIVAEDRNYFFVIVETDSDNEPKGIDAAYEPENGLNFTTGRKKP